MVKQTYIPKYYGLRIFLSAMLLYFFLVLPFLGFIAYQQIPDFIAKNQGKLSGNLGSGFMLNDSVFNDSSFQDPELLEEQLKQLSEMSEDSILEKFVKVEDKGTKVSVQLPGEEKKEQKVNKMFQDKGPFSRYFSLLLILMTASLLLGLAYNLPFKRFFHRKRKGKEIKDRNRAYCRKYLIRSPLVNSLIITLPNIAVIVYGILRLLRLDLYEEDIEQRMFFQLVLLTIIASLLELLFVYYWQKHRVHLRYIDHVYEADELRSRSFRGRQGRIRNRLAISATVTTFLPLVIVMAYLLLSLSSVSKLKKEYFSSDHQEILLGPWSQVSSNANDPVEAEKYKKLFYVNAVDSIVMLVGIGNGILASFIYLLLFVRWNNRDIVRPVSELLAHMKGSHKGEKFAIVRTNDEIGELAEGYNEMSQRIQEHVEHIETMNRELEDKVRERTKEVVEQKEEIETQKEEIEAQLDLATQQRDTISLQNEQILDSIHYAKRIQSALLPPLDLLEQEFAEHFVLFRPRDIVSGDFYWLSQKGSKLVIALADCTGHGVPGAFLSTLGISSLNTLVSRMRSIDPAKMLNELRRMIISSLHQDGVGSETRDGIEIALLVIDTKTGEMEYSGANRPLYLVSGEELEHLKPDRMSISLDSVNANKFSTQKRKLKKGDSLYLFSDGYVDQMGGEPRKTFRAIRLRKVLMELQGQPMSAQKKGLDEELDRWQGQEEQIDDILFIGLKL